MTVGGQHSFKRWRSSTRGGAYVGESLAATDVLTLVRLLTGVRTDMDRQSTSLNEALSASWGHTRVRSLVGVYPVVSL